ncbi:MAG: PAS domain S-box protein [Myxococcota bacterium]
MAKFAPAVVSVEDLFRLLESASAGVWSWDVQRDEIRWSNGLLYTLDLRSDEAPFRYCDTLQFVHPEDVGAYDQAIQNCLRKHHPLAVAYRLIRRDGSMLPVRSHGQLSFDAGRAPARMLGFIQDRSDEEKEHQALKNSEARFRTLFDRAPVGMYIKDEESRHIYANDAAAALLGRSRCELEGRRTEDLFPPDIARRLIEVDQQVLSGRTMVSWEGVLLDREGRSLDVTDLKFPVPAPDGTPLVAGFAIDLTERRRLQEERSELERRMQRMQHLESMGLLAGGVAHDFNNLLVGILGQIELAQSELPSEHPANDSLLIAAGASRRAAELCGHLLSYSGGQPMDPEVVDLNELVSEKLVPADDAVRMEYDLTPEPVFHYGDRLQLRQVVSNLVVNARDAIGAGEGGMTIRTATVTGVSPSRGIVYDWTDTEDLVRIQVQDTGHGIEVEALAQVFDPFFSTKPEGHGLGLAAVLGIIRRHKGAIAVENRIEGGTCVSIYLPASPPAPALSSSPTIRTPSAPRARRRALVVDDEALVRSVMGRILKRLGLDVDLVESGSQALQLLHGQQCPDIIFLDLTMPGLSGADTLKSIRDIDRQVPVIIASGYSNELKNGSAGLSEATGWLLKPFGIDEVRQCLERVLHQV